MDVATFLNGATAMACLAIAAFFARFWRESEHRAFLYLTFAFGFIAVSHSALALLPAADERRVYAFVLRLVGLVAVLAGVAWKNRDTAEHMDAKR